MSPLGINTEDMHGPSMETTVMVVNRTALEPDCLGLNRHILFSLSVVLGESL